VYNNALYFPAVSTTARGIKLNNQEIIMKFNRLTVLVLVALTLGACGGKEEGQSAPVAEDAPSDEITVSDADLAGNPFLEEWDTPYGVPPFSRIENGHYMPAIKKGILEQRADIDAIVNNAEAPTFENTIIAMETAGELLTKVAILRARRRTMSCALSNPRSTRC
jgi:peptidyl-dipeptidase Dcp